MNYAEIKPVDIANGPGVRVSVFVSGCNHHCKGCFNEIAWDFDYGKPFTNETVQYILKLLEPDYIKGLTILGGEPFDLKNQLYVIELVKAVREKYPNKSIWCFTGYVFDKDIITYKIGTKPMIDNLLKYIDVLVDGPFIETQKNLSLRFRGSENQRLIDIKRSLYYNKIILLDDKN